MYPRGDAFNVEDDVQRYFDEFVCPTLRCLYNDVCGRNHYFGRSSVIRLPFTRNRIIKPDIVHMAINDMATDMRSPDICFAIGDYKKGNYDLMRGLEDCKVATGDYKST